MAGGHRKFRSAHPFGKKKTSASGLQGFIRSPSSEGDTDDAIAHLIPTATEACNADLKILNFDATFPGSVHASFVWRASLSKKEFAKGNLVKENECLLAWQTTRAAMLDGVYHGGELVSNGGGGDSSDDDGDNDSSFLPMSIQGALLTIQSLIDFVNSKGLPSAYAQQLDAMHTAIVKLQLPRKQAEILDFVERA
ncbi:hypothetical protein HPB47_007817 [Ixodes persulcatus]|uniref:Uncharacterized protein n=1 Tax=Ixodes persulcatus TaxID=34615 RepID=A0AC60P6F7_IXOPE|nr:hypothetical protein HPB47_007817 [Ixodes persulcatus]